MSSEEAEERRGNRRFGSGFAKRFRVNLVLTCHRARSKNIVTGAGRQAARGIRFLSRR